MLPTGLPHLVLIHNVLKSVQDSKSIRQETNMMFQMRFAMLANFYGYLLMFCLDNWLHQTLNRTVDGQISFEVKTFKTIPNQECNVKTGQNIPKSSKYHHLHI